MITQEEVIIAPIGRTAIELQLLELEYNEDEMDALLEEILKS